MPEKLRRFVFVFRFTPIFLIIFFLPVYKLTWRWIPISGWMVVFILGIAVWATAELVLRYRAGMKGKS
jgi:hypothetical protein